MPTFKNRTTADISIKRGLETVLTVPITRQSRRTFKLMEKDEVTLVFSLAEAVHFKVGDYIVDEVFGTFVIKEEQTPNFNKNTGGYDYQLVFVAPYMVWDNHEFTLTNVSATLSKEGVDPVRKECSWLLTNDLEANLKEFIRCLDVIAADDAAFSPFKHNGLSYVMQIHPTAAHAGEVSLMTYDSLGMVKALNALAQTWHCEWWVTYEVPDPSLGPVKDGNGDNVTGNAERGIIHFGMCKGDNTAYLFNERPVNIDGEKAPTVEAMSAQRNEGEHANRLFILGGTNNLPESYRKKLVLEVESISWDADNNRNVYLPNRNLTEDMLDGASVSTETVTVKQPFDGTTRENLKAYASTSPWHFTRDSSYTRVYASIGVALKFPANSGQDWNIEANAYLYRVTDGVETLIAEYNKTHTSPLYRNIDFDPSLSNYYSWFNNIWDFGDFIPVTGDTYDAIKIVVEVTANKSGLTIIDQFSVGQKTGISGYAQYSYEKRTATNRIETVEEGDKYDVLFNPCNNRRPAGVAPDGNLYYFFALDKDGNWQLVNDSDQGSPMLHVGQEFTVYGYNPIAIPLSWYTDEELDNPASLVGLGERRLKLPIPTGDDVHDVKEGVRLCYGYVEKDGVDIAENGRVELTVKNDDIYPRCFLKVTEVATEQKKREDKLSDGSENVWPYEVYVLKVKMLDDTDFPFRSTFVRDGDKLRALFISEIDEQEAYGEDTPPDTSNRLLLAGMEFDCRWDDYMKTLTILTNEDYGAMLPNDILKPSVNDTLVLTGWDVRAMEDLGLVSKAEERLWKFAREYLNELNRGQFTFTCDMMSGWAKSIHDDGRVGLHLGNAAYMNEVMPKMLLPLEGAVAAVVNDSLPKDNSPYGMMLSRVLGYEFKLDYPWDTPKYTIGETEAYSRIKALEKNLTKAGSGGGSGSVSYGGGSVQGGTMTLVTGSDHSDIGMGGLNDVKLDNLANGHVLVWNGTKWVNATNESGVKELVFVDYWMSGEQAYNKISWDGKRLYYYRDEEYEDGEFIAHRPVKDIIPLREDTIYIDKQNNIPYRWDGENMTPIGTSITIPNPPGNVLIVNGEILDLSHKHEWGDLVNKPNLVEGIVIGNNCITFRLTTGELITANFDTIVARLQDLEHWRTNPQGAEKAIQDLQADVADVKANKASAASLDALSGRVDGLSIGRGMVIDPYIWGTSSDANAADWTGCEGEYWYNTDTDYIYLCIGVMNGLPQWHQDYVAARCLVYNENNGELWLYQNLNANPSHIVIHQ